MKKIKKIFRAGAKAVALLIYRLETILLPVSRNTIVMSSNMGRNYTGNPRAVYEEMIARGLDRKYRIIWFFDDIATVIPGNAKKVKYGRAAYLYYMAIAKVWLFDCRQPVFLKKKKTVAYIQTWHGTPLKRLALDMEEVSMAGERSIEEYKENFRKNTGTWDYLISQNHFSTEIFSHCFDFHKKFLEIGYPRNDVLFSHNTEEYRKKLRKELGLPSDKKIILYAPTWRDNEFYAQGEYKFNPKLDFAMAQRELEKDYVFIVKYHYLVKDNINWDAYRGFIYDFDLEYDIAQLYLAADILITDYSSVMFDFSLLSRPMLFYAYDLEEYKEHLRGFYFDFLKEAPGAVSLTTEQLVKDIKQCGTREYDEKYCEKYRDFQKKYNHADDGQASVKVAELIQRCMS